MPRSSIASRFSKMNMPSFSAPASSSSRSPMISRMRASFSLDTALRISEA